MREQEFVNAIDRLEGAWIDTHQRGTHACKRMRACMSWGHCFFFSPSRLFSPPTTCVWVHAMTRTKGSILGDANNET